MNKLSLLTTCVLVGMISSSVAYATNKTATNNTSTPAKSGTTASSNTNANTNANTQTKAPATNEPANPSAAGIDNQQKLDFYKKNGRPPDVPLIPFSAWNKYTNSSWGFAEWRAEGKGGRLHAGVDFGTGGSSVPLQAPEDITMVKSHNGAILMQRDGAYADRILYFHAKAGNVRSGRISKGTVVGTLSGYGYNKKTGQWLLKYGTHDHYEYHVRKSFPQRIVRIPIMQQTAVLSSRNDSSGLGSLSADAAGYRAVEPTPYWQYDFPRSAGGAGDFGYRYKDFDYLGNTFRTKYNALYIKQLPVGQFEAKTAGTKVQTPTKQLPPTLLNQISSYMNMPITDDMLAMANGMAVNSAVMGDSAGFDYGTGAFMTQRMLASSFADDDGEPWQAIFGAAEMPDLKEMTETQLIRHMVTKRYGNPEWAAALTKLSTKGLMTEYLSIQAEKNYLTNLLTQAKLDTMKQEAIFARALLRSKDKAIEAMYESIEVNIAPDFLTAELEAAGDEWVGSSVPVGGGDVGGEFTGVSTGDADLTGITAKPFEGFGARIDGFIKEASSRFNVDEKTLRGFVKMEGGWKGAMSQTGAIGVGQFTQGTWDDLASTSAGQAIGMQKIGLCFRRACDPRRDDRINTLATALLIVNNTKMLTAKGIPATPENLYMAHNMGPGFLFAIHGKQKFTSKTRRNMDVNGGRGMTPEQFIKFQQRRYLQHYADANFVK